MILYSSFKVWAVLFLQSHFQCLFVQGRGLETNLYAQFKCDSMKIAMVMNPIYYKINPTTSFFNLLCDYCWQRGVVFNKLVLVLVLNTCNTGEARRSCSVSWRTTLRLCHQVQWVFGLIIYLSKGLLIQMNKTARVQCNDAGVQPWVVIYLV